MAKKIVLYEKVDDSNIFEFIQLIRSGNRAEEIQIDFKNVKYYTPTALVALIATIHSWIKEGKIITFVNYIRFDAFRYFQRVDFFNQCGVALTENFLRHEYKQKFLPIKRLGLDASNNIEEISNSVADIIAPEQKDLEDLEDTGLYDCIQYSVSELGNNVIQHSTSYGFIASQYYPKSKNTVISIADIGIGILESFRESMSPHYENSMTDLDAIKKALQVKVSSKTHINTFLNEPINRGVGLTLLSQLAQRMKGNLIILSGNGFYSFKEERTLEEGNEFLGTLCSFTFNRDNLKAFHDLLYRAKKELGLIKSLDQFNELFE